MARTLSEKEWWVLDALWEGGPLELGELVEALSGQTGWSRNTVHTYLKRMADKGLVRVEGEKPPHRYAAAVSREDCAARARQDLLTRVYQGSAGKLVAAFVREGKLTAQEREELRKLLDDMEV